MLRFAPSPIGDMHIGNLRVAILNYIVAKQKGERFLVRIEDNYTKENIEGKDTEIMMLLEKFAIKHDLVYHRSEHLGIHQTLAIRLLQEEKAFICKCTEEELKESNQYSGKCETLSPQEYKTLKESGEPFVIRLKKPINSEIDSFVIMNRDNTPTSDFASACDDMLSNISLVIQTEEHLSSTPKQIHIKSSLGYEEETTYVHIPTISSDEVISVKWLFEEGFIPDAILNYLLLLGNPNTPKEIFTLPEAIEWFDLDSLSKSEVKFDMSQLQFINREHLRLMDDKRLSTLFGFADADIGKLAKLYLQECSTINELQAKIKPIFRPKNFDGEWGEQMRIIEEIIFQAPAFETFDQLTKHIIKESKLKDENLFKPLRILLTGAESGVELNEIYPLIKSYLLEVAS